MSIRAAVAWLGHACRSGGSWRCRGWGAKRGARRRQNRCRRRWCPRSRRCLRRRRQCAAAAAPSAARRPRSPRARLRHGGHRTVTAGLAARAGRPARAWRRARAGRIPRPRAPCLPRAGAGKPARTLTLQPGQRARRGRAEQAALVRAHDEVGAHDRRGKHAARAQRDERHNPPGQPARAPLRGAAARIAPRAAGPLQAAGAGRGVQALCTVTATVIASSRAASARQGRAPCRSSRRPHTPAGTRTRLRGRARLSGSPDERARAGRVPPGAPRAGRAPSAQTPWPEQ